MSAAFNVRAACGHVTAAIEGAHPLRCLACSRQSLANRRRRVVGAYLDAAVLDEMSAEAERQGLTLSAVAQLAMKMAIGTIRRLPGRRE